jgi:predicted nucleic acid-binding protein
MPGNPRRTCCASPMPSMPTPDGRAASFLSHPGPRDSKQPCVTFVTVGELTQWAELRQWGRRNRDALENWLGGVIVLPYSEDVARTWGRISAAAIRRGGARPANDTWIAACALTYGLPLATPNVKDFEDFSEYEGLNLIVR